MVSFPSSTHARLDAVRHFRMDTPDHACPWGLRALELLQEQGISFEDIPLRSDAALAIFKRRYGVNTTPQVFSGQERIGGYSDLAARLGTAALVALALGAGTGGFLGLSVCRCQLHQIQPAQPALAAPKGSALGWPLPLAWPGWCLSARPCLSITRRSIALA